ncbi:MAG: redoxin domain-containing protein [Thermoleophilia bacterium]
MLQPGDPIPDAQVWTAARELPVTLVEALGKADLTLLCFYPFDWSQTCTNEIFLLRDRGSDLERAGIRPVAISRDSPWSHEAWVMTLGVDDVPLLSDWSGEATRGFGVSRELYGMAGVPDRCAFLITGDTVRASWYLGSELPDIDAAIAAASSLSL